MIAVLKSGVSQEQINNLIEWFKSQGLKVHLSEGDYKTILGLIGDTTKVDIDLLKGLDIIESVTRRLHESVNLIKRLTESSIRKTQLLM